MLFSSGIFFLTLTPSLSGLASSRGKVLGKLKKSTSITTKSNVAPHLSKRVPFNGGEPSYGKGGSITPGFGVGKEAQSVVEHDIRSIE
jgi:hypothetical protein